VCYLEKRISTVPFQLSKECTTKTRKQDKSTLATKIHSVANSKNTKLCYFTWSRHLYENYQRKVAAAAKQHCNSLVRSVACKQLTGQTATSRDTNVTILARLGVVKRKKVNIYIDTTCIAFSLRKVLSFCKVVSLRFFDASVVAFMTDRVLNLYLLNTVGSRH